MLCIPEVPILLLLKSNSIIELGSLYVNRQVRLLFSLLFLNYNLFKLLK